MFGKKNYSNFSSGIEPWVGGEIKGQDILKIRPHKDCENICNSSALFININIRLPKVPAILDNRHELPILGVIPLD